MAPTVTTARQARALERALEVANPYLDEFLEIGGDQEVTDLPASRLGTVFEQRSRLVRKYSWAIPSAEAVATIAAHGPAIELGAGAGYWSMLVAAAGGDVVAYDAAPPGAPNDYTGSDRWFDVRPGSVEVLEGHADRTLVLCWPPYDDPFARRALEAYGGDTVIYVGEGWGGCTGDDTFHELLSAQWQQSQRVRIPHWPGLHDTLSVHRRR